MAKRVKFRVVSAVLLLVFLTAALLVFLNRSAPAEPLPPSTPGASKAAAASNAFGLDLFQKLRFRPGNLLISPYSLHTAMAMSREGAAGTTADELDKALHLDPASRKGERDLHTRIRAPGYHGFELHAANRLWAHPKIAIHAEYAERLNYLFACDVASLDFDNPIAAAATINQWTSDQTRGRIPQIATPADLAPPTAFVLTNALYFKGNWDKPFKRSATKDGVFFTAPGQKTRAKLMSQTEKHFFGDFEKSDTAPAVRALSMNYTGKDLAMLLLLPELGELDKFEAALSPELLKDIIDQLNETDVPVTLPRFKFGDSFSVIPALQDLGITAAFDRSRADFSKASTTRSYIAAVLQKTFIELNEEGTEAAAATAVIHIGASPLPRAKRPPEFKADHPFLLILHDRQTETILFLGRLSTPTQ
jgi:serpin B